jgi:hypothetical protein
MSVNRVKIMENKIKTNEMLMFVKDFFDKRKVKYVIKVTDEGNINVSARE